MRHCLDTTDFTVEEIDDLIHLATDIIADPKKYAHVCDGKKLATLFFEPSTRTRLSFEAAMLELGGNVLGFAAANSSSASKGETVGDTVKIVSCYADIIAMRHPLEGAPRVASFKSDVPIINAGDGGHSHPTQTLTDLLTIYREKGRLDHLTIGLCGDLKFGRTVHSLIKAMCRYTDVEFVLISPKELAVPDYIKTDVLDASGMKYTEVEHMEDVMPRLDVLYMTRIQRERFFSEDEYLRHKDAFVLDPEKMESAKSDLTIMHPMVQMGNAPTAWTASSGDYLTTTETKTEIKQTVSEIKLTASTSGTSSTIKLTAGGTEITSAQINLSGVVTFSDLSTWNQDKTIINGGNITTGQIHNKARTTTYDLDNAWIRMGKDAGTRVDIDTGRIRWYWENNLTGVLSSRYGKSYIGDNSRYTFLGWFSTGDPSFDYSTGGATSEFVGIAIDQVDKVIHCNASKFEIPGRIECGSLSVNGREI